MKKYEFIVQDVISKICQNVITMKLPSERELAESYEVSRFTIRKALEKLESIGIVTVKSGSGIFINGDINNNPLVYNSITENSFRRMSYSKLTLNKRVMDSNEKRVFILDDDDYIWNVKRLRLIDGKVIQIEEARMPVKLFPKMNDAIIESSLQKHALDIGLDIEQYLTTYRAVNTSKEEAQLLGCKRGAAAMNITNRGFLSNGEVFIISDIIDINYQCTYHAPFNSKNIQYRDEK
ncbi:GntR family transcriptional regulator [Vibrio methylphosphonaticus]|uniref:GntR family transcriptional regulator n=1 Tax=Vibrio methylphosphonaticus TaxID=2946866 RepID=UPI002029DCC7|nr:GntR family transcriptional regulator [Vibrio methylphosphonaticus]MCL9777473.1 GntR family transcriptional regulator [Vibrio methylphosphonaticus]